MDLLAILGRIGFDLNVFIFNLINFSIVIFIIKKYFFEKIQDTIDSRKKLIEESLEKEVKAQKALENAEADAQIIIKKANFDASNILNKAKENAESIQKELSIRYQQEYEIKKAKMLADVESEKVSMLTSFKYGIKNSFTNFLEDFLTKKAASNADIIPEVNAYADSLNLPNEKP